MDFLVYILYSPSLNKFYIGYTSGPIELRLRKHLAHHKGFTGKRVDWELKYTEPYKTKQEAMQREKQIKDWKSRKKIIELLSSKTRSSR